jgi:ankyrin repeat protein
MRRPVAHSPVFLLVLTASIPLWQSGSIAAEKAGPTTAPAVPESAPPPRADAALDLKLIDAAGSRNVERVKALLDQGADVNARNGEALFRAVTRQRVEIAKLLIARGAKPTAQCGAGWTALHWAAPLGQTDLVDLILDTGALVDPAAGPSPLHVAACHGQAQVVILLLGRGADARAPDSNGATPLHAAASEGSVLTIQLLIGAGADVNGRDASGRTPLFTAIRNNEKDAAVLLLCSGADINARDDSGQSVLKCARDTGTKEMVDMLVERGAKE